VQHDVGLHFTVNSHEAKRPEAPPDLKSEATALTSVMSHLRRFGPVREKARPTTS
jgi:hypothetical protein